MDLRVAGLGLALLVVVAGCATQPTATADDVHKDGFESGTTSVQPGSKQREVSREGFEAGVTATEIPVPTPTPSPAPGAPAHSSR